jgi:hypothetical protein
MEEAPALVGICTDEESSRLGSLLNVESYVLLTCSVSANRSLPARGGNQNVQVADFEECERSTAASPLSSDNETEIVTW